MIAPSSRKVWFSETTHFLKSTQTAWNHQNVTYFKNDQNRSYDMSQGPLCPNLSKKVQKEVYQMANHNLPHAML